MSKRWLSVVTEGTERHKLQLRQLRKLRLAMQDAVQNENWSVLARLDRLCHQTTETLTLLNVDREMTLEMVRIRELYRNMVISINRHLSNSVQAH